jgi:hypothetical protein
LICSRTADVWAGEVVAQWQAQQQLAAEQGNVNKVSRRSPFAPGIMLLLVWLCSFQFSFANTVHRGADT